MKKLFYLFLLQIIFLKANAGEPLIGSGNMINKRFDYKNFDKVYLIDFAGKVEIAVGKTFTVHLSIDDNLLPLLDIKENHKEHELTFGLKNNKNGKAYIETEKMKLKITMPETSVIINNGNTNITVNGILGRYFRFENLGNGNAFLTGSVDKLDLKNKGNGNIKAFDLKTADAVVRVSGNGNVKLNATETIEIKGSGNGNVSYKGDATLSPDSEIMGNGDINKIK